MLSDTNTNSDQYESGKFDDVTIETIDGRSFPHKKLGNITVSPRYTLKGLNLMKNLEIHDGYSLTTMQLNVIKEKTSFNIMKATKDGKIVSFTSNEAYFRSGSNETWKDYFTQEQALKFDQLVPFPYDYKEK
uniref:Sulfotransferase domain-containing protein n=1 Tax=Acrobeloides nanus TaxID=290746 RepID=A0A914ESP4_9BILA